MDAFRCYDLSTFLVAEVLVVNIRLLSYNIHKGFDLWGRFTLEDIRSTLRQTQADLILLQEVVGENAKLLGKFKSGANERQFEYLADTVWPHFSYGKNAVFPKRHHGNATLSKYPIKSFHNLNLTMQRYEMRGLLHTEIEIAGTQHPLHILNTHLDLFEKNRFKQIDKISDWIFSNLGNAPFVLAGDFNDWTQKSSQRLTRNLGSDCKEAFLTEHGKFASSFPSYLPFLTLDRVHYRGLTVQSAQVLKEPRWTRLSDHLPLLVDIKLSEG